MNFQLDYIAVKVLKELSSVTERNLIFEISSLIKSGHLKFSNSITVKTVHWIQIKNIKCFTSHEENNKIFFDKLIVR